MANNPEIKSTDSINQVNLSETIDALRFSKSSPELVKTLQDIQSGTTDYPEEVQISIYEALATSTRMEGKMKSGEELEKIINEAIEKGNFDKNTKESIRAAKEISRLQTAYNSLQESKDKLASLKSILKLNQDLEKNLDTIKNSGVTRASYNHFYASRKEQGINPMIKEMDEYQRIAEELKTQIDIEYKKLLVDFKNEVEAEYKDFSKSDESQKSPSRSFDLLDSLSVLAQEIEKNKITNRDKILAKLNDMKKDIFSQIEKSAANKKNEFRNAYNEHKKNKEKGVIKTPLHALKLGEDSIKYLDEAISSLRNTSVNISILQTARQLIKSQYDEIKRDIR